MSGRPSSRRREPVGYRCHRDGKEHVWLGEQGARVLCRNCDQKGPDCRGSMASHIRRYLLRAYGVDTWKGRRVRLDPTVSYGKVEKVGTVVGHRSGYVLIKWDGEKRAGPHHVLWALQYLDDAGSVVLDGRKRADEINEAHRTRNERWAREREQQERRRAHEEAAVWT